MARHLADSIGSPKPSCPARRSTSRDSTEEKFVSFGAFARDRDISDPHWPRIERGHRSAPNVVLPSLRLFVRAIKGIHGRAEKKQS